MSKAKIDHPQLPKYYKQAINDPKWRVAIDEELTNFEQYNSLTLVPIPDKKIFKIPLFWLFASKSDGRYKARLVALGNLMKPGRDFDPNDTYCGNVSAVSIKIALSLASNFNLIMKGGDLKGAYLVTRSNPDYVTYIATPQGYNIPAGYVLVASGNEDISGRYIVFLRGSDIRDIVWIRPSHWIRTLEITSLHDEVEGGG